MRSFIAPVVLCAVLVHAAPAPQNVNELASGLTSALDLATTAATPTSTPESQPTLTEPSTPKFVFVDPITVPTTASAAPTEEVVTANNVATTASPAFTFVSTDSVTAASAPTLASAGSEASPTVAVPATTAPAVTEAAVTNSPSFTFVGTDASPTVSTPTVTEPAVTEPTVDHVASVPTTSVSPESAVPSFTYTGTDIPTTVDTSSLHVSPTVSVSASVSASVHASVDTTTSPEFAFSPTSAVAGATSAAVDTLTSAEAVTTAAAAAATTSAFAFQPTTAQATTSSAVPIVPIVAGAASSAANTIGQQTHAGEGSAQPTVVPSAASINIAPVAPVTTAAGVVVADHTAAPSSFVIGSQTVSVGQAVNIGNTLAMIQTTGGKTELWVGDKTSELSFPATAAPAVSAAAVTAPAAVSAPSNSNIQVNSAGSLVLGSVTLVPGETFTQTGANNAAQTVAVYTSAGKTQLVIADASGTHTAGLQIATVVPVPDDQSTKTDGSSTITASADAPAQTTVNGQVYNIGGATLGGAAGTLKTTGAGGAALATPSSGSQPQKGAAAKSQATMLGAVVIGALIGAVAMV